MCCRGPPETPRSRTTAHVEHINWAATYFTLWTQAHKDQNAYIEQFNRTYREEVLDAHLFDSITQVRELTESWIPTYNEERPHDSLGRVPPLTFMPRQATTESTLALCA